MSALAAHGGSWQIQHVPMEVRHTLHGHARTTPHEVLPAYRKVDAMLDASHWTHAVLMFPDELVPPSNEPIQVLRRILVQAKNVLRETDLAAYQQAGTLDQLPFDVIEGVWLPHPADLLERPTMSSLRERTAEAQAAKAQGLGFIAVTGGKGIPVFKVGFANPYSGEITAQPLPIDELLLTAAKTGGRPIETIAYGGSTFL